MIFVVECLACCVFHYAVLAVSLCDLKLLGQKYQPVAALIPSPRTDLKTALVERNDFSSGTSSRSTKLIHGGVRYLQKAILKLDYEQVNALFSFFGMADICQWNSLSIRSKCFIFSLHSHFIHWHEPSRRVSETFKRDSEVFPNFGQEWVRVSIVIEFQIKPGNYMQVIGE